MEPISPSVYRSARRNTALSVSTIKIARGKYRRCPPLVMQGSAFQAATASSVNQTVRLPCSRRAASHAAGSVQQRCKRRLGEVRAVAAGFFAPAAKRLPEPMHRSRRTRSAIDPARGLAGVHTLQQHEHAHG